MDALLPVFERLPRASIEGACFILAVALACRLLPRLRARERAALWWLAAAKLLVGLVPVTALAIAVLPADPAVVDTGLDAAVAREAPSIEPAAAVAPSPIRDLDWRRPIGAVWAGTVLLLLAASVPGALRARRWRRAGAPFPDPAVRAAAARAAAGAGLRTTPPVLAVPGLSGPMVAGLLRPSILLPADAAARMSTEEIAMALAHEMAHVARRDLALGLVPALARRVFFFHPLAWLVEREYAVARESACDEEVVARAGIDVQAYGRLLLRLSSGRPAAAAASFSPRSMLRRRLEMIESMLVRSPIGRTTGWAVLALAAILLIPVRLVASERAPATSPAPASAPAPASSPESATAPTPPPSAGTEGTAACLDGAGSDSAYVVFDGARRYSCGQPSDVEAAKRARKDGEDLVWFRVGTDAWVVRDPATIAEAKAALDADRAARDGERAESEGDRVELEREREMARRDAERARRDAGIAARHAREQAGTASADDATIAQLEAKMEALNAQMDALAREMDALAQRRADAGARQERLAREMAERAPRANAPLGSILDDARKSGAATRVH